METSKVYFTDFRTAGGVGLPEKLAKLCRKAGIMDMDMKDKFVAIKMHFGELGNIAYLRPNYAKAVADLVKEAGGKPSQASVAESSIRLLVLHGVQVKSQLLQSLLYGLVGLEIYDVVAKGSAHKELH